MGSPIIFFFVHHIICLKDERTTMPPPTTVQFLALCAALAAVVLVAQPATAAVVSDGCICSDVRPRVGTGKTHTERFEPAATCLEIREAGQCQEKWLLNTVKELEGDGYCMVRGGGARGKKKKDRERERRSVGEAQVGWRGAGAPCTHTSIQSNPSFPSPSSQIKCGRCKCCQPVAPTLRATGLTALLDAAAGTIFEAAFNDPSFEATVLVPSTGVVKDVAAHVLPPVPKWGNATWTAELLAAEKAIMSAGGSLPVSSGDGPVLVGLAGARVRESLQACKTTLIVVDKPVVA
jgi:hypothetical protein